MYLQPPSLIYWHRRPSPYRHTKRKCPYVHCPHMLKMLWKSFSAPNHPHGYFSAPNPLHPPIPPNSFSSYTKVSAPRITPIGVSAPRIHRTHRYPNELLKPYKSFSTPNHPHGCFSAPNPSHPPIPQRTFETIQKFQRPESPRWVFQRPESIAPTDTPTNF
jgi:hypothetical protein